MAVVKYSYLNVLLIFIPGEFSSTRRRSAECRQLILLSFCLHASPRPAIDVAAISLLGHAL